MIKGIPMGLRLVTLRFKCRRFKCLVKSRDGL